MTSLSDQLHAVADTIQARGWARGPGIEALMEGTGMISSRVWGGGAGTTEPLCLEGAIMAVHGISVPYITAEYGSPELTLAFTKISAAVPLIEKCEVYTALHKYLNLNAGIRLFEYNDHMVESMDELIAVIRACAVLHEDAPVLQTTAA